MIYLDNAATGGKKPESVIRAVNTALTKYSANPGRGGHTLSIKASEIVYETRKRIADMFGVGDPARVIFTPSCTYSLNTVIKGVLKKGENIVISSLEHNSVFRPAVAMKSQGVSLDIAEVIFFDPDATVRSFERTLKPNTKLVVCTHASNVTGEILPIKQIGELCKSKGILFMVDGAQSAGSADLNMEEMNIDFLAIAPHKGLYAPMGVGVLICRGDIPNTLVEGGTGVASASPYQPEEYPERLESGTLNLPGIAGIMAGVDFINKKGRENIYNYQLFLVNRLYSRLKNISRVELYTPAPTKGKFVPLLSFNMRNFSSSNFAELMNKEGIAVRGGLHCSPLAHKRLGTAEKGTVRVSVSAFNTPEEIDFFARKVAKYSGM